MSDIGEGLGDTLKQKLGPLPLGVWAVIVGAGIGLYLRRSGYFTPTPSAPSVTTSGGTADTVGNLYSPSTTMDTSGTIPSVVTLPRTNEEWAALAQREVIGHGYDPLLVTTSIAAFLNGNPLTPAQQAVVREAILLAGAPPYPVNAAPYPVTTVPTPITPVPTPSYPQPAYKAGPAAGTFIVPGPFNAHVSLRSVAASLSPPGANANTVEVKLRALYRANPTYLGQTSALGGHVMYLP